LFSDLDRKQANEDISKITADAFIELYEFAKEIGDEVTIGEAKNANFQVKVDAHQGDYQNNPSVFTANVTGELKIWPARMIMDHDSGLDSVAWDAEDYHELERAFQSMNGVPRGSTTVRFETVGSSVDIDQFKSMVEMFVSTCRKKAQSPS
jgi:hypothetical protein